MKIKNKIGKMFKHYIWIICFSLTFNVACTTLKPIQFNENRISLTDSNLHRLNGKYSCVSFHNKYSYRTLDYLLLNDSYSHSKDRSKFSLSLNVIDIKRIKISVYKDSVLIKEKVLRGRIKQDYFTFNLNVKIRPLWVVINGYSAQKSRIGILKNGNLTADTEGGGCGLLVVFPFIGAGSQEYNLEYKKIE